MLVLKVVLLYFMSLFRYEKNLENANNMGFKKGIAGGLGQSAFWFFLYVAFAVCFWYGIYLIRNDEAGFEAGETLTVSNI